MAFDRQHDLTFQICRWHRQSKYAIRLDYGLNDKVQISGFYSETDDPLNAPITGLDVRPANLWEVFGASLRWQLRGNETWSLALNGSLEVWNVGSGGSNSLAQNTSKSISPNIFNDSGRRVETKNYIGSLAVPLTWHADQKWQFTFTPGINFLPASQGERQGGAGEFFGTNLYFGGGVLWQPIPQIGITASVAKPLGGGSNSFDRDRKYSRVPILSGGLNWHLNPRIALQGQLTNGFGATPATALLTLPSDNRMGYSAKLIINPDAVDTPQPSLTSIQRSLSIGGLTVNTALVPPDKTTTFKISTDTRGNLETTIGYSLSNIFELNFFRSVNRNTPQNTPQARAYLSEGMVNWRGSGKAVLTSQLRESSIWSAVRISFGQNTNYVDNTKQGYLFAEIPLTWEAGTKVAFNINPKVAWTEVGSLWGLGLSSNIRLSQRWELIPEVNIVLNSQRQENNASLCLRWNASDDFAIETYGSTLPRSSI